MAEKESSSALNVMCAICSEFYRSSDTIYSTTCGHLFHYQCLFRWISRVPKCPQCTQPCIKQRVHRVFLNFGECTEEDLKQQTADDLEEEISNEPQWLPIWLPPDDSYHLPKGVVQSCTDPEGNAAYVARVYHRNDLLPAAYVPTKKGVYAPWACKGHFLTNELEILIVKDYKWVPDSNGRVPQHAIPSGYSVLGEGLYTGRAVYNGIQLLGKVHPSHGVLYMAYNGNEVNSKEYEVLVAVNNNDESQLQQQ